MEQFQFIWNIFPCKLCISKMNFMCSIKEFVLLGDYRLLEQHERGIGATLEDFHNDHVPREWPAWCWRMTRNSHPVRQETDEISGRTDNGNEPDTQSGGLDTQRYGNVARPRHHNVPHPSEHRSDTTRPQANREKSKFLCGFFHSQSPEPGLQEPRIPVENPPSTQCCLCGKRIQVRHSSTIYLFCQQHKNFTRIPTCSYYYYMCTLSVCILHLIFDWQVLACSEILV